MIAKEKDRPTTDLNLDLDLDLELAVCETPNGPLQEKLGPRSKTDEDKKQQQRN